MLSLTFGAWVRHCVAQIFSLNATLLHRIIVLKTFSLITTIFLASTTSAHGQTGNLDLTFAQTGTGLSNNVFTLAIQTDGKILAGGGFLSYNGTNRQRLARLNTDGTLDNTFVQTGSGINAGVRAVVLQSDGKILVGGDFTAYNGVTSNYVARLNADGTLDASFTPTGTGVNSTVYDFSVLNDGRILLIGSFTSYNGTNRSRILRLNADGTLDATFNQTGTGINNDIYSISVQSDGKILVGGNFTDYNGIQRNNIARLNADGTLDNSFSQTGTGLNNQVFTLAIQPDGKILAGGSFSGYNGTAQNSIARLNSDGTLDQTFSQTGSGLNNPVRRRGIIVLKDSKILIGGDFTAYDGITQNSLARLNSNGTLDNSFVLQGSGFDNAIASLAIQPDGNIITAGNFSNYNGISRSRIARIRGTPQGIISFTPAFGSAGTSVVITGSGFTGATAVSFGGIPASSFTVNSDTQITAVVGSSNAVTGGQQLVVVTAPAGTFSLGGFSIGATAQSGGTTPIGSTAPPSAILSGFSPQSIGFGTPITLSGSGFTGATGLLIGGVPVTNFVVVNDNIITAVVGGVPVSDRVVLTGGLGASLDMSGLGLSYNHLPSPAVASISPSSLTASGDDTALTFSGFNFLTGARVLVREQSASANTDVSIPTSGVSTNQAMATLPGILRSPGTKVITLLNPDGQSSSITLTVVTGAAVRLTGNGGNESAPFTFTTTASGRAFSVRLAGANIFRTVRAFVGDVQTQVTVASSTEAIIEVPASVNELGGNSLTLRLLNSDGQSTTATLRIERRPPPTIVSISIQSGGILLVRGVNFLNGIRVALANTPLTVLSQEGDVAFTARIPASFHLGANTQSVSLTVENPDGRAHGILLPRSLFEGDFASSSAGSGATERTWEAGAVAELMEAQAGKQVQGGVQELSIYPNPIESELRVSGTGLRTVRLYDMRGSVVLEERTQSGVVNVNSLPSGAYMVVVEATNGRIVQQRVMKK